MDFGEFDFNWAFNFDFSGLISSALQIALILVVTWFIVWWMKRIIPRLIQAKIPRVRDESSDQTASRSESLSGVIVKALAFVVWLVAWIMVLSVMGVNTTPIIAAVGLAGLAVGFAAQSIIRDYFHGFFILMEDWYRVGEVATVAGIGGLVTEITLRRTVLRDLNGTMHVIPNGKIELASNMARDWARINLDISVGYGENLDRVVEVINDVCKEIQDDPELGQQLTSDLQVVRVNNLGDHGIDIKIMGDTKPMQQWSLSGELRKHLKDRFDQEGIEIPWPHTKVYFGNTFEELRSNN
jgi:small conductance mechanosensitive channel